MFEILSHGKPACKVGTRLVGGPSGLPGWPIWYIAEVDSVVTIDVRTVLQWLERTGMLNALTPTEISSHQQYIAQRMHAGDLVVHVLLFSVVHDVKGSNINLRDGSYLHPVPHPRSSSLLAYMYPAPYWHEVVEKWLYQNALSKCHVD
jgi:hypothetical protein